jgi:hypothetical protein
MRPRPDDKAQSRAFIEAARAAGADDATSSTDDVMAHLTQLPPESHEALKRQAKKSKAKKPVTWIGQISRRGKRWPKSFSSRLAIANPIQARIQPLRNWSMGKLLSV